MADAVFQELVRQRLGLRVGPEMAAYMLRLAEAGAAAAPVIAADARTGIPRRVQVPMEQLRGLAAARGRG